MYFSIDGHTTVEYGLTSFPLPEYSAVIIQPGVVHTNSNTSSAIERHITLLMPQLEDPNEPLDIEYERKSIRLRWIKCAGTFHSLAHSYTN